MLYLVVHWALGSSPCICLLVHHSLSLYSTLLVHHSLSLYILICLLYNGTLLYYIIHFNIQRIIHYSNTAYFLEYCNALNDGFVAELNALMKYSYCDVFFVKLTGKSVDELWNAYKAHYE